MTTTEQNPPTRTAGLGELMRAKRLYTGLSQRGFAKHLNDMDRRSYQRYETGQDDMPPGLLDTVDALLDDFDSQVAAVIEAADREIAETNATGLLPVFVPTDPRQEYERCIVARAAVDGGHIMPVLRD